MQQVNLNDTTERPGEGHVQSSTLIRPEKKQQKQYPICMCTQRREPCARMESSHHHEEHSPTQGIFTLGQDCFSTRATVS